MAKKFIVYLMNSQEVFTYEVNCASEFQAKGICMGIFTGARVIEIKEMK